jgi:hypothetical protein
VLATISVVLADGDHRWSGGNGDWTVVSGDVTLQVLGHSGKIKLRTTSGDDKSSVEVSLDKLVEVNSRGDDQQHSHDLASSDFEWGTPSWELVNGVNTTRVPLNATVRVDKTYVPFGLIVWLYQADGTVTWHGESYAVKKNHAKFTVSIGSWPFMSVNNTLQFQMELKVKTKSYKPDDAEDKSDDSRQKRIKLQDRAVFDIVKYAYLDGVQQTITATTYTEGSKSGLRLSFPYYTRTVDYDPTIGLTSAGMSTAGIVPMATVLMMMIVSVFNW